MTKNKWTVKMVNPEQIAKKKYRGCGTTQAVKNFCTRYRVNCFWWTPPTGGKKILMIDFQNFRNYYKAVYGKGTNATAKTTNKSSHISPTTYHWNSKGMTSKRTRSAWNTRTKSQRTKTRRAA
jgi:hypothetical protein